MVCMAGGCMIGRWARLIRCVECTNGNIVQVTRWRATGRRTERERGTDAKQVYQYPVPWPRGRSDWVSAMWRMAATLSGDASERDARLGQCLSYLDRRHAIDRPADLFLHLHLVEPLRTCYPPERRPRVIFQRRLPLRFGWVRGS